MAKIVQLDPHVADLIAAGEVVERPGSVIKELMENAIDAGATMITVEIKGGGMTFMRVTDNGCGMAADDAVTAFLRHATSKLHDERGLESIITLGFRGEALAAIAAVSKIDLLTREFGTDEGTNLVLEGGILVTKESAGCPDGTTIIVRDLFYNTPARLKFMKTDRAEGANTSAIVLRCALSHPEVSVRYIKDGKEECHTPGDGRIDSCIYSLFGRDFAKDLLAAETNLNDVSVTGYISSPIHSRGNRNYQFFFVNGRFVKSKTLQAALEQAYKNSILSGRYPACVLYITIPSNTVDVNVHPTKTEVKFQFDHEVFDGVYYASLAALSNETKLPELGTSRTAGAAQSHVAASPVTSSPRTDFFKSVSSEKFRSDADSFKIRVPVIRESNDYKPINDNTFTVYQTKMDLHLYPAEKALETAIQDNPYRIIGETMGTYIIVEDLDRLLLIDKHAAHERIHFDKLKAENQSIMTQQLVSPVVCDLGRLDTSLLLENTNLLEQFGFEIDGFGETSVALRQIPYDIELENADAFLGELCEKLRLGQKMNMTDVKDELMHTIACKAAIKAGKQSQPFELHELVKRVLSGEIRYCPHGRPVSIEFSKSMLDKSFKRT